MGVPQKCTSCKLPWRPYMRLLLSVLLLLLLLLLLQVNTWEGASSSIPSTETHWTGRLSNEESIQGSRKQEIRRERLARVCLENKGKTNNNITWNRFKYDPVSNVLYCSICKIGSTTYTALYSRLKG